MKDALLARRSLVSYGSALQQPLRKDSADISFDANTTPRNACESIHRRATTEAKEGPNRPADWHVPSLIMKIPNEPNQLDPVPIRSTYRNLQNEPNAAFQPSQTKPPPSARTPNEAKTNPSSRMTLTACATMKDTCH